MSKDRDLLLTVDNDLDLTSFDLNLTGDTQIIAQRVRQTLLLFKGEWFLDKDIGVPYYEQILGQKNSLDSVRGVFIDAINGVQGVKEIINFDLDLNSATGNLTINLTLLDSLNNKLKVSI